MNAAYLKLFSNGNQFLNLFTIFLYFYSTSPEVIWHIFESILLKQSFVRNQYYSKSLATANAFRISLR